MALTHDQMVAQIAAGQAVLYRTNVLNAADQVPTDAQIELDYLADHPAPGAHVHSAHGTVADGAALTVWTPGGGKRFRLQQLLVGCDAGAAATPHEVKDGAATLAWACDNGTNDLKVWLDCGSPGYLSAAPDQVLSIVNHAGGPVAFVVTAVGDEV